MKKALLLVLISLFYHTSQAQKVAIIGSKSLETTEDGVSILALENLTVGEVFYFTENEYDNIAHAFVDAAESVVSITITSNINKGNVIYFKESASTPNTFSTSVTAGSGTVTVTHVASSGAFSIGSLGEILYLYSDNDTDPTNGVTEIHSAFFPGSGSNASTGGAIPATENPSSDFPNAVITHNFPEYDYGVEPYFSNGVNRVEYNISVADRTDVNKVKLENPANYVFAGNNQDLSTTVFTNFNLVTPNPVITLTTSASQLDENSSSNFSYTFTSSVAPTTDLVINFSVNGSSTNGIALFGSDYTQSGATSMDTTSGTVTIASGTTSKTIILNPTEDTLLEPDETIELSILAGTGYDFGSPSIASSVIKNDDTKTVVPEVAITGLRHYTGTEDDVSEFSFVALKDIPANSEYVFSSNSFDKNTLTFSDVSTYSSELKWIAPAGGILRGDVIVVKKTAPSTFTITRNGSLTSAGSITKLSPSKNFFISEYHGLFIAHTDTDDNPYNGISEIHSMIYTYDNLGNFGGAVPSSQDLSTLYIGAILVDGFPNISPGRLEYKPSLRPVTSVDQSNFENPSNWLYAEALEDLSSVPFTNIIISEGSANPKATVVVSASSIIEDSETATYTFNLDAVATTNITINFSVAGSAIFSSDYTVSGANSFTETTGSITILSGTSSAQLTLTPVNDVDLETTENIELTITAGIGYDGGSPGSAMVSITNDDTDDSEVKLAIIGINHESPSSMSLVAMNNITANSTFYFLRNQFNKETLSFQTGGKYKLVTPNTCIPKGTVLTITGGLNGPLTVNCNSTSGSECGTATIVGSGNVFDFLDIGTRYYAFQDTDEDHTNGISQIHSVFHTGGTYPSNHTGGILTPEENPKSVYSNAVVVDGFPNIVPNRTEFDPSKRNIEVSTTLIENVVNYIHAQPNATLSTTNFNTQSFAIAYVNSSVPSGGDGTSWANAYNSLQDALANASTCFNNEIWVADGTYKPHETNQSISFSIPANTKIYGGFSGTETDLTQRNFSLNSTILSGDLNNSNSSNDGDSYTIVKIHNNNVVLDGFILEYSYANGTSGTFEAEGAGIYTSGTSITINNTIFRNNTVVDDSTNSGGAVYNTGSIDFYNCLFYNNTTSGKGGAIYTENGIVNIVNCTIANNTAADGGGITTSNDDVTIVNTVFYSNTATQPDIYEVSVSNTSVSYSSFDNSFPIGSTDAGNNFINSDPSFIDTNNNNYQLKLASPLINSGNGLANIQTKDLAGNLRKTMNIDIGAYEYDTEVTEWLGTTNINWDEASNWSNGVPSNSISVILNVGASHEPIIDLAQVEIKDMTIRSGATLTINSGKLLLINRNLELLGNLVVNSDATSNGSLIIEGSFTGNSNINYQRYVTDNWHLVSAPVIGETYDDNWISNNSIASGTSNNRGISTYNNNGLAWEYIQAGSSGTFNSGTGYSIKTTSPSILNFTGSIITDNVSVNTTEGTANKWNLIGNPYPSFVNANSAADAVNNFLTVNSTQLDPTKVALYLWNSNTSSYDIINQSSGASYIAPGQGFFVNTVDGGAVIDFTETMQSHQTGNHFYRTPNTTPEIKLSISDGIEIKTTQIKYFDGTTTGLDPGYDAGLFNGTSTNFSVYSHLVTNSESVDFALQCLPDSDYERMVIPIGISATSDTEIVFSTQVLNLPDGMKVYLEDREKNMFTKLDEIGAEYKVNLNVGTDGIGRFYLHTTSQSLGIKDVVLENINIYKTNNKIIRIVGLQDEFASVKLFDILGKELIQQSFKTGGVKDILLPQTSAGVYIVHLQTEKGKLNKKIIID
ncbi:putative secreted protein (Por secretion system target) [Tenacibaculum adriaticum]|uniref:Putative secreted protein (Por secretion system target) n=1 Tax=Tenacibaculum adriaticum TaxID=413713 RepID=A0A5S5DT62_9FLAO|nr:T9SS type A sorting domain-containing protein [Tenacibaculum adriaticum]TYP99081.1 putative secreted protein (Por secretion system target) [Tenacibaculum adriaticum]